MDKVKYVATLFTGFTILSIIAAIIMAAAIGIAALVIITIETIF